MNRVVQFVAQFVVVGLAIAFLVVLFRPSLLRQTAPEAGAQPSTLRIGGRGAAISYADAVARSAGSVVNIYTARVVPERTQNPPDLNNLLGELWPRYRQRVERSLGSGVIIDEAGHIVTNDHVVTEASSILVQLADGRTAEARVVGRDPDTDLAVLEIKLDNLPTMPMGRSDSLRVGDVVLTIGSPVGLSQTVTQGIVSAIGRGLGVTTFESFIQTDAAINVGNSGGALINTDGELVGINTAVFSRTAGIEGIGFAIPVNLVRGVMDEIFRNGRVIRGWLGIIPGEITPQQAKNLNVPIGMGVMVANLYTNSPAYAAGVRPGDIILQINNESVTSGQQALAYVASLAPGSPLKITYLHEGKVMNEVTKVEERPLNKQ